MLLLPLRKSAPSSLAASRDRAVSDASTKVAVGTPALSTADSGEALAPSELPVLPVRMATVGAARAGSTAPRAGSAAPRSFPPRPSEAAAELSSPLPMLGASGRTVLITVLIPRSEGLGVVVSLPSAAS